MSEAADVASLYAGGMLALTGALLLGLFGRRKPDRTAGRMLFALPLSWLTPLALAAVFHARRTTDGRVVSGPAWAEALGLAAFGAAVVLTVVLVREAKGFRLAAALYAAVQMMFVLVTQIIAAFAIAGAGF